MARVISSRTLNARSLPKFASSLRVMSDAKFVGVGLKLAFGL